MEPAELPNPFLSPLPRALIKQTYKSTSLATLCPSFSTKKPLSLHITTYNVSSHIPTSLTSLFPSSHDIYIIGLQEVDTTSTAYVFTDPLRMETWKRLIASEIKCRLVVARQVVGLMILVYASNSIPISVSYTCLILQEVETASISTGILGMANKGGVAVRMRVYDSYITIIDCHLASGDALSKRNQDVKEIGRISFTGRVYPWTPRLESGDGYCLKDRSFGATLYDTGIV
jgi:phosphatidylinositol-bisphosphatase